MSKKFHVQKREFLNLYTTWRAYIIASVEDTTDMRSCCSKNQNEGEVFFEIASCNHEIELHFSLATAEDRENSLHKANKLAEVVIAFRDAIEKEVGIIHERQSAQQHSQTVAAVH